MIIKLLLFLLAPVFLLLSLLWFTGSTPPGSTPSPSPLMAAAAPTPRINEFALVPWEITAGSIQPVTFNVVITDPSLIASSVVLLLVSETGKLIPAGTLRDDGTNGDTIAGDTVFTFRTTFFSQPPGVLKFRVSAAYRGMLRRVQTGDLLLRINPATSTATWQRLCDQQHLFCLKFPLSWAVRVNEEFATSPADGYALKNVLFELSAGTPLVSIAVYTKSSWTALQSSDEPTPVFIAETQNYVFAYGLPADQSAEVRSQLNQILATFQVQ